MRISKLWETPRFFRLVRSTKEKGSDLSATGKPKGRGLSVSTASQPTAQVSKGR